MGCLFVLLFKAQKTLRVKIQLSKSWLFMKSLLHSSQSADVGQHCSQSNFRLWFCCVLHTAQLHNRLASHVSVPVARFLFRIMKAGSCMFSCELQNDYSNTINTPGFHVDSFRNTPTVSLALQLRTLMI